MGFKKVLKTAGKTLGSMLLGAVIGLIISVSCGLYFWLPAKVAELPSGLGALVGALGLIIVTVMVFSALGIVIGAVSGLIVFLILKLKNKKRLALNERA